MPHFYLCRKRMHLWFLAGHRCFLPLLKYQRLPYRKNQTCLLNTGIGILFIKFNTMIFYPLFLLSLIQVERTWDLVRDSGQRKLTYSSQNHCTSSRSVYLSRRLNSHLQKWESQLRLRWKLLLLSVPGKNRGSFYLSQKQTPTSCFLLFYVVETGGLTFFAKSR